MRIIDVHAHALPASYLRALDEAGVDARAEDGFPAPAWSPAAALEFMDETGIDFELLSVSSPHPHFGDDAAARAAARAINDDFADLCRRRPDRFGFVATLPVPDVRGAVAEAARACDDLGALGVKLPSNARGVYLGSQSLWPLYEYLDDRARRSGRPAVAVVHPCPPPTVPGSCFTSGPKPLFEFVADTTRSMLDLIAAGVLARWPRLRFVVPHCGSYLPLVVQRLAGIQRVLVPQGLMAPVDVEKSLESVYFDLAGDAVPVGVSAAIQTVGAGRLMYGSDFPYTPAPAAHAKLDELLRAEALADCLPDVMGGTAARLFGL